MASITKAFAITAIALSALTFSARPAQPQTPTSQSDNTTDMQEESELAVEHRLIELDLQRLKISKSVPTQAWQTAFCGWGDDAPRPQYLGTLFAQYAKANRATQAQTIKWVELLADELVARGDAKMFLLLASHYVKTNYPSTGMYSPFLGEPNTFGLDVSRIGNLLKTSLKKLSPAEQIEFKKNLGEATASYLVANIPNEAGGENPEPQNGFVTATLGYELMTEYAYSDEGLAAFEDIIKTATFAVDDLRGFFTLNGVRDFITVTAGFIPKTSTTYSGLTHIFNMGLRTDKESGEAMRNMFIDAIKLNKLDDALFAINYVYRLAAEQRYAGKDDSLAQQTISPVWDDAVSGILTPKMIRAIYLNYYTGTKVSAPQTFYIARKKQFTGAQEIEMRGVYTELLRATVKNPRAYYNMVNDLLHDETFRTVVAKDNAQLVSPHILAHVSYLAAIYMEDHSAGSTVDSNIRMMHLMRLDAALPPAQRVTTAGFQRAIVQLAKVAKRDSAQSAQIAKLVATANNTGWDKHITPAFIGTLRQNLLVLRGSFAEETLDSILRVQADKRALAKQWSSHTQIKRNSK